MIRTCDLCLRRAALYPLSYGRLGGRNSLATRATQDRGAARLRLAPLVVGRQPRGRDALRVRVAAP